ncbi:hypothetical protein NQ318_001273 [Aromia moschata]|uniref:Uncharacterized protein n=1 Tax=Aromia moschata TaxID=1265417 RepID=A0AAV8ZEX6_9CUCU|nr:hypothetical protein NQ318_001273 [Aromia moschata]
MNQPNITRHPKKNVIKVCSIGGITKTQGSSKSSVLPLDDCVVGVVLEVVPVVIAPFGLGTALQIFRAFVPNPI